MKKVLIPAGVVLLILVVAFFVYKFMFGKRVFTVQAVAGVAEIESGGVWIPLAPGAHVPAGAKLRTGKGGKVVLASAKGVSIEVKGNSVVEVKGIKDDALELKLERGELSTLISPEGAAVKKVVMNTGGGELEIDAGSVIVASDGRETVSIYAPEKETVVKVNGKEVEVKAEEKVVLARGEEKMRVRKNEPMKLKVNWPPSPTRFTEVEISGETEPGAGVFIGDVFTYADSNGHFTVRLKLSEGKNELVAMARDVLGREKMETYEIVVDTTPPDVKIKNKLRWE